MITSESKKSDVRKTGSSASSASKNIADQWWDFPLILSDLHLAPRSSSALEIGAKSSYVSVGSGLGEIGIHNKKTQKSQDKIHH